MSVEIQPAKPKARKRKATAAPALVPGDRQTVEWVLHPQRGEGVFVHDNGPSFFRPDGGEPVAMTSAGSGARTGSGSYRLLVDPEHGTVEAKVLKHGDLHSRKWSPLLGAGWLVYLNQPRWGMRFDADDGRTMSSSMTRMSRGTPSYVERSSRTSKVLKETPEERLWITLKMRDGTVLAFRDSAPAEAALETAKEAGTPAVDPTVARDARQLSFAGLESAAAR